MQCDLNLGSRGFDLLLSDSPGNRSRFRGVPPCLSDPCSVTTTAAPCLAKFPGFAGSAHRFSQPLSGLADSWLCGLVSYRLRPWDSLVFEVPPSRGSVLLSEPRRPCRSTRLDRSTGPPKLFTRVFQEGPRRHASVAARTPTRGSHPRPELDRACSSEGLPLPRLDTTDLDQPAIPAIRTEQPTSTFSSPRESDTLR